MCARLSGSSEHLANMSTVALASIKDLTFLLLPCPPEAAVAPPCRAGDTTSKLRQRCSRLVACRLSSCSFQLSGQMSAAKWCRVHQAASVCMHGIARQQ